MKDRKMRKEKMCLWLSWERPEPAAEGSQASSGLGFLGWVLPGQLQALLEGAAWPGALVGFVIFCLQGPA